MVRFDAPPPLFFIFSLWGNIKAARGFRARRQTLRDGTGAGFRNLRRSLAAAVPPATTTHPIDASPFAE